MPSILAIAKEIRHNKVVFVRTFWRDGLSKSGNLSEYEGRKEDTTFIGTTRKAPNLCFMTSYASQVDGTCVWIATERGFLVMATTK